MECPSGWKRKDEGTCYEAADQQISNLVSADVTKAEKNTGFASGARLASIRAIPLSFSARGPKINNIEKKV